MPKTPLLATGLNGLTGSKFSQLYAQKYQLDNLDISSPSRPVDITNYSQVRGIFESSPAQAVIHLAAFTDVAAAWNQSDDKSGLAYQVNVIGTQNIVKAAAETGKHLIHVSTAFVFDGTKDGLYTELDSVCPIEWYGHTKAEAEAAVQLSTGQWTILRIDFPFRSDLFLKPDIVRKTIANMRQGLPLFTDHYFGPTYIDDFAKVIEWAVRTKAVGLYHASSGESWTDFQLGEELNKTLSLDLTVERGSLSQYLTSTSRPYQLNTALNVSKLVSQLDFKLFTVQEALTQLQIQS